MTPFNSAGRVDLDVLTAHVEMGLAHDPGAVFTACGTGEFHALGVAEHEQVVRRVVEVVAGRIPVFAGTGGPLPVALEMARAAEQVGIDGLLVLPPYLVQGPPAGLVRYTKAIANETALPLIVYNRETARYDPASAAEVASLPTVVGFKDGRGDIDSLTRIILAIEARTEPLAKDFQFFNGLPTAEISVAAYRGLGVPLYSSAVFCFAPEISVVFHRAINAGDDTLVRQLLNSFFAPFVELRDQSPGGAVSLVKAAVRLRGLDVGGVRPPLVDPGSAQLDALQDVIDAGLKIAAEVPA